MTDRGSRDTASDNPKTPIGASAIVSRIGLVAGPLLAVLAYLLIGAPDETAIEASQGLTNAGRAVAAIGVLMAIWWLTEAIPLPATALLPIVLFPLLSVMPIAAATAPYADPIIFLFMGGFMLGLSMERWGLHKRIALATILIVGTKPIRLIGGFMLATAVMSMWVSNTATAVMMLPIGISVIALVRERLGEDSNNSNDNNNASPSANFATCLMLGIAYAASIGGVGTLIGTPPNTVLAGFISRELGQEITFARWLMIGLPFVAIFLPLTWFLLVRFLYPVRITEVPGGKALILAQWKSLGRMKPGEWATFIVFIIAAFSWVFRSSIVNPALTHIGLGSISDAGIAIAAGLTLFIAPIDRKWTRSLQWEQMAKLPWGILLLFGGGLSLAAGLSSTGVDAFLGGRFEALTDVPPIVVVLLVALAVIFLTELTSNTAVTTSLMPVLAAAGAALGVHPYLLLVPCAMAASCAFMLPVATPPNAIVFASGRVTIFQMMRAGLVLNIIGALIITLFVIFAAGPLLGVTLGQTPDWIEPLAPASQTPGNP